MTKDGKLNIGVAYSKSFRRLAQLTGLKDTEAVRRIVENILYDAEQAGLPSVAIQQIGIKDVAARAGQSAGAGQATSTGQATSAGKCDQRP